MTLNDYHLVTLHSICCWWFHRKKVIETATMYSNKLGKQTYKRRWKKNVFSSFHLTFKFFFISLSMFITYRIFQRILSNKWGMQFAPNFHCKSSANYKVERVNDVTWDSTRVSLCRILSLIYLYRNNIFFLNEFNFILSFMNFFFFIFTTSKVSF